MYISLKYCLLSMFVLWSYYQLVSHLWLTCTKDNTQIRFDWLTVQSCDDAQASSVYHSLCCEMQIKAPEKGSKQTSEFDYFATLLKMNFHAEFSSTVSRVPTYTVSFDMISTCHHLTKSKPVY